MIDTRQNRPLPVIPKELCTDAAQTWNASADGRRDTGDSRFSVGASGGRPKWSPDAPTPPNRDDDTAETGRYETPTEESDERIP